MTLVNYGFQLCHWYVAFTYGPTPTPHCEADKPTINGFFVHHYGNGTIDLFASILIDHPMYGSGMVGMFIDGMECS
jgi:hypothetical protein